jgi:hypothetical protein
MGNRKTTKQIKKQFVVPPPAAAPACPKVGPSPQDFPEGSYTYFFFLSSHSSPLPMSIPYIIQFPVLITFN